MFGDGFLIISRRVILHIKKFKNKEKVVISVLGINKKFRLIMKNKKLNYFLTLRSKFIKEDSFWLIKNTLKKP